MTKEKKEQTMKTTPSKNQIRAYLRNRYGARNYRITRDGEIHIRRRDNNAPFALIWILWGYVEQVKKDDLR